MLITLFFSLDSIELLLGLGFNSYYITKNFYKVLDQDIDHSACFKTVKWSCLIFMYMNMRIFPLMGLTHIRFIWILYTTKYSSFTKDTNRFILDYCFRKIILAAWDLMIRDQGLPISSQIRTKTSRCDGVTKLSSSTIDMELAPTRTWIRLSLRRCLLLCLGLRFKFNSDLVSTPTRTRI
jgi:hypothetical protein